MRILIVDDDRGMARTLCDIFKAKGHSAEMACSGSEALQKAKKTHFDCVITDVKMPKMNGVELYRAIKAIRPELAVVLMTAYSADKLIKEGLGEGVIAALTKPLDINLLLNFFSSLRKERSIVVVDDDLNFSKTLADILRQRGFRVIQVADPHSLTKKLKPDEQVVLLDMKLKSTNGLVVLKNIRKEYPYLPVILVTGYRKEMVKAIDAALKIGAYACLYKPLQIEKLLQLLTEIHQRELGRTLGRPVRWRKQGKA